MLPCGHFSQDPGNPDHCRICADKAVSDSLRIRAELDAAAPSRPDPTVAPDTLPESVAGATGAIEWRGAGIYEGIPDEAYHLDRIVPGGSLSSTGARQILSSPAWFRYRQEHREESKPFDLGHAVHAKVLGVGMKVVEIPAGLLATNGATSTKAAKEFMRDARAKGLVPLKAEDFAPVNAMAEAVLAHPTARLLLEREGIPEASVFAEDPVTGEWFRARPDFLPEPARKHKTVLVDLKTSISADPRRFRNSVAKYGYHQQDPWYCDAVRLVRGDRDVSMAFVIVESHEPWLVSVCELLPEAVEKGRERNRRALDLWHQCRTTNRWPGYGSEIYQLDLPAWAMNEEELPDDTEDA